MGVHDLNFSLPICDADGFARPEVMHEHRQCLAYVFAQPLESLQPCHFTKECIKGREASCAFGSRFNFGVIEIDGCRGICRALALRRNDNGWARLDPAVLGRRITAVQVDGQGRIRLGADLLPPSRVHIQSRKVCPQCMAENPAAPCAWDLRDYLARFAQVNLISVPTLMGLIETMAVNVHAELEPFAGVRTALLTKWARYCPYCLGQREIWRLAWEVRFADACTHCGHWLLDVCPACGAPQSWWRSALALCHQCGGDLCRAVSSPAPQAVVRLSQALEASVTDPLVSLDPAPLHGLTVVQRVQLVRLLGAYGAWNGARVPQKIPDADRLHVSWRISTVAAEILSNWPEGFQELFARLRQHADITDAGRMRGAFGGLYAAIYRGTKSPAFDFLRRAFEDFVAQAWTGAIGRRNRRLDPAVLQRLQWIPAPAARELFGVSPTELRRLVADGRVGSVTRRSASGREFELVRKDDVERTRRQSCDYVTLQEAAHALGLKRQRLSRLLPRICPEASKDGEAGVPWRIPRSFLDAWRERLCGYPAVAKTDVERQVTVAERLRFGGPNDEEIVVILTGMASGSLEVIGVLGGVRQIPQVVLRRDALRARREANTVERCFRGGEL